MRKGKSEPKNVKKTVYMLRCHNGMYAYKDDPEAHWKTVENPFRLSFSDSLADFPLDTDALIRRRWFMTVSKEQAKRYRDENNAFRTEADIGYALEIVRVDVNLSITPGQTEYERNPHGSVRKGRHRAAKP